MEENSSELLKANGAGGEPVRAVWVVLVASIAFVLAGALLGLEGAPSLLKRFSVASRFFSLNEPYGMPGADRVFGIFPFVSICYAIVLLLLMFEWRRGFRFIGKLEPSAWWLAPVGLVLYLPFWGPILGIGDSAGYAALIDGRRLDIMTIHWGNTFWGILWTAILPFDVPRDMNLWGIVSGIGAAIIAAKTADRLTENRLAGLFTGLALIGSIVWWYQSVLYKSYMGQTFWWMLALYLWIKDRPVLSGWAFLFSMLYSPLSVLAAPAFLLGRVGLKKLGAFTAASLPIYLLFLFFYRGDFFFGGRGLFHAADIVGKHSELQLILSSFLLLLINFSAAWLLVPVGMSETRSWPRDRRVSFWLAAGLCMLGMMIIGVSLAEFPSALPFLIFPALLSGAGYLRLARGRLGVSGAACVVGAVLLVMTYISTLRLLPEYAIRSTFRSVCTEVSKQFRAGDVLVMRWNQKVIFGQYARPVGTPDVIDIENEAWTQKKLEAALSGYTRVWVLEADIATRVRSIVPLEKGEMGGGYVWRGEIPE